MYASKWSWQVITEYAQLFPREWQACRRQRVPVRVLAYAMYQIVEAWWHGWEFVGAQGGLQWSHHEGWQ
jgi:hypothetical protein